MHYYVEGLKYQVPLDKVYFKKQKERDMCRLYLFTYTNDKFRVRIGLQTAEKQSP